MEPREEGNSSMFVAEFVLPLCRGKTEKKGSRCLVRTGRVAKEKKWEARIGRG